MRGRSVKLSIQRRMVIDFLHFARAAPTVPVQKFMSIADVVAARAACRVRPKWTAIFVKALALVADEMCYLKDANGWKIAGIVSGSGGGGGDQQ